MADQSGDGPGTEPEPEPEPESEPASEADGGRVFRSAAARRAAALRVGLLAAVLVGVVLALQAAVPGLTDPDWVRARVTAFGPLAPLAFVALQTVQVVLAPIPGQILGGVGGLLFGTLPGTAYSLLGVAIGSAAVFVATKRYGRPYVERAVEPSALERWDGFVERTGVPGLFVLFLLPTFPDDLLCLVAGLTEIRLRTFLPLVIVGRAPSFLAAAYAGTRLGGGSVEAFVAVVTALAVLSVVVYGLRDRIVAGLDRLV